MSFERTLICAISVVLAFVSCSYGYMIVDLQRQVSKCQSCCDHNAACHHDCHDCCDQLKARLDALETKQGASP